MSEPDCGRIATSRHTRRLDSRLHRCKVRVQLDNRSGVMRRFKTGSLRTYLLYGISLLAAAAALPLALVPGVSVVIGDWSRQDVELRSKLLFNSIRDQVALYLADGSDEALTKFFERLTDDEKLLGLAYCNDNGRLRAATKLMPASFTCGSRSSAYALSGMARPLCSWCRPLRQRELELGTYQELQAEAISLASSINERHRMGDSEPIKLVIRHHEPDEVLELFRAADVCIVSSLHDGINLVAKEFVAARDDEEGVLVLSHFAGASRELTEALIVNPYDTHGLGEALQQALTMTAEEQRMRMLLMRALVRERNVYRWAGQMLLDAAQLRRRRQVSDVIERHRA